jgi:hypothetical protein
MLGPQFQDLFEHSLVRQADNVASSIICDSDHETDSDTDDKSKSESENGNKTTTTTTTTTTRLGPRINLTFRCILNSLKKTS